MASLTLSQVSLRALRVLRGKYSVEKSDFKRAGVHSVCFDDEIQGAKNGIVDTFSSISSRPLRAWWEILGGKNAALNVLTL